jgi:hypothetical protein
MTTGDPDRPADGGEQRPGAVDDEIWTELVAAFHASPSHQPGLWPDAEDLPRDADGGPEDEEADDAEPEAGTGLHRTPHSPDAGTGFGPGSPSHGDGHPGGPSRVVRPAARPGAAPPGPPASVTWTGDAGAGLSAGAAVPAPHSHRAPGSGGASGAAGPRDWQTPDVEDGGFVPPNPPPLELGMATKAAWLLGLGGPLYLTLATILHWDTPQWASLLCILSGIAGFGYLVSRLKDRPDDNDDDPDDPTFGAVV